MMEALPEVGDTVETGNVGVSNQGIRIESHPTPGFHGEPSEG